MQSFAAAPSSSMHQHNAQDVVSEQILREQLLSQVSTTGPSRDLSDMQTSSPASPNDHSVLDPSMTSGLMGSGGSDDGNDPDGRKGFGKRELSTSKRAAQNRAAQRAFRQRKEGYIKKLEEQVRDYALLNENFKALQAENYQLRDYIINLQSRLIESQGEYPQPPPNIDGLHPGGPSHHPPIAASALVGLDPVRGTALPGRASELNRHTPEASSHYSSENPVLKRHKAEQSEMTTAQQALQGRPER